MMLKIKIILLFCSNKELQKFPVMIPDDNLSIN